ncbi:MAG: methylornithine synthase PylB [Candidatus Aminicenantes bacterium]|nr:methylornithine synthase PylB [Candidatus Aminicenantes bacterium]NIM84512.1 methylornithine synthase PylB [Candidatus Aminicenantes bacterium]NIN24037.1 methylornithine synthase PylB [Candidatus Aminicenantes bacterium]NIN47747.1 methylornithine synthase PylB [Candidatus Aminicenantes bacterium]NIN90681.1 methylornithine synthase PylB [Candidatus Aminicenantes bacterium]
MIKIRARSNEQIQTLDTILNKARQEKPLTKEEIIFILQLRQKEHIDSLFRTACSLRRKYFRDKIFLYGFLYISTYCRNDCNFCFYRVSNRVSPRYRKSEDEVIAAAVELAQSGVHLIDLTMGEDPYFFNDKSTGFDAFCRLVEKVKAATGLPVMVSPGVVPEQVLVELVEAGADWFSCYQETHNRDLFQQLRPGQDYDARFNIKQLAHKHGLLIEEGILVGVGETVEDIANSLEIMQTLDAGQVRAMNVVPQAGTPMQNHPGPEPIKELLTIALMRLVFPGKLIPATLDVEGLAGLKQRLEAGANVVTSIVPPHQGLVGVAQSLLDIDDARRATESVLSVLEDCGLRPQSVKLDTKATKKRRR